MYYVILRRVASKMGVVVVEAESGNKARQIVRDDYRREHNSPMSTIVGTRMLYSSDDPLKADEFLDGYIKKMQELNVEVDF